MVGGVLKDCEPISALAADNLLHIDNSGFRDEYKIILSWEKNKPSGPRGQNFVFLPGTHKALRKSFQESKDGLFWTTESIFRKKNDIQKIFDFQYKSLPCQSPIVVEAYYTEKPLTIAFAAGSLVHQRYQTDDGASRSCVILPFRNAEFNEGSLCRPEELKKLNIVDHSLMSLLLGYHGKDSQDLFINAITNEALSISTILQKLINKNENTIFIDPLKLQLKSESFEKWNSYVTNGPTLEQIKYEKFGFPIGKQINRDEFFELIKERMLYDKYGQCVLRSFSDNHEEIRKWVRIEIREMNAIVLEEKLRNWKEQIEEPTVDHLLSPSQIKSIANVVENFIIQELIPKEEISKYDKLKSIAHMFNDLADVVVRCESKEIFLTTCYFMFWTYDFLKRLHQENLHKLELIGHSLFMNYVSTGILFELQFRNENKKSKLE